MNDFQVPLMEKGTLHYESQVCGEQQHSDEIRGSSRSFWVTHNCVYETQYRWQTTPHFQHRWDRVFLLILFLRKLSPRKELKMRSSPMSEGVRMWLLLQAAVQVVHLFRLVIPKGLEMYKQNLPAGTEISLTTFFLNWFNTFRNADLKAVLDEPSSRTNYCKQSDIKILCLPSHTKHVLRPLLRTLSKP